VTANINQSIFVSAFDGRYRSFDESFMLRSTYSVK